MQRSQENQSHELRAASISASISAALRRLDRLRALFLRFKYVALHDGLPCSQHKPGQAENMALSANMYNWYRPVNL